MSVARSAESHRWSWVLVGLAVLVLVPVLSVAASVLTPSTDVWRHLWRTRLPGMLTTTVLLLLAVGVGTLAVGGGLAWLVSAYRFPGRRLFGWLLVLPLAIPAYVLGFVFLSFFGYTGPIQDSLRQAFGEGVWFPEIRSVGGAAIVLTMSLYPYVYLLARAAIAEQGSEGYEQARVLGQGRLRAALRVVLPLARPSLAAGLALVMMETLTDFATVLYFNVDTVSVGVFRVWKGMFDRAAAGELAALVLLFAVAALVLERALRGGRRYEQRGGGRAALEPHRLTGLRAAAATSVCALFLAIAFGIPVAQLVVWSFSGGGLVSGSAARFTGFFANSALLAGSCAVLVVAASVLATNAARFAGTRTSRGLVHLTTLGYALPGPVVAIGVLLVLTGLDRALGAAGIEVPGLVVTGSIVGLVYAYFVRFLALGVNGLDASLQKVPLELTMSARSLGATPLRVLGRVHAPLSRAGMLTAILLVAIDAVKELPVVLLLRPFGFDTLSVWVWQLASESRWEAAALPALTIVVASVIPVGLLVARLSRDGGVVPHVGPVTRAQEAAA